jgi:hypothetical protein
VHCVNPPTAPRLIDQARAYNAEHRADPDTVRTWIAPLLDRAHQVGPVPHAGSRAWKALPSNDPRKLAAVITAGLAWLDESTPQAIAARLVAELDQIDAVILARQQAASADVSTALGDQARLCYGPSYLVLELRRAQPGPDYRGTLAPHEIDRINRLTEAVRLFDQLLLDPTVSVRDAQTIALSHPATVEDNAA